MLNKEILNKVIAEEGKRLRKNYEVEIQGDFGDYEIVLVPMMVKTNKEAGLIGCTTTANILPEYNRALRKERGEE